MPTKCLDLGRDKRRDKGRDKGRDITIEDLEDVPVINTSTSNMKNMATRKILKLLG